MKMVVEVILEEILLVIVEASVVTDSQLFEGDCGGCCGGNYVDICGSNR